MTLVLRCLFVLELTKSDAPSCHTDRRGLGLGKIIAVARCVSKTTNHQKFRSMNARKVGSYAQ